MIGIIGAMEEEIVKIRTVMETTESSEIAGMIFYQGKLYNKELVLVNCGIGKVNAAVCTQILISVYKAELIINTGIAGGLTSDINIGDIVLLSKSGKVRNTSIVLVDVDGITDFRRVLITDDVTLLIADDKDIKPVPLTASTKLYGTVVEIRKVIT